MSWIRLYEDEVLACLAMPELAIRRPVKIVKLAEDHGKPMIDRAWIDDSFGGCCLKIPFDGCGQKDMETTHRHYCDFAAGEKLWVKETWGYENEFYSDEPGPTGCVLYRADGVPTGAHGTAWRSSTSMPREFSRIVVEVVSVAAELVDGAGWVWRIALKIVESGRKSK